MPEADVNQAVEPRDHRSPGEAGALSGSDLAHDSATDEAFQAVRLGRLLDIIGTSSSAVAPLRLLDAGCGTGRFARAMTAFGHSVDGIDTLEAAVEAARAEAAGHDRYFVSDPVEWAPPHLYDAVYAMDLLSHLTDDEVWRRSVTNFASLVRLGGLLVLADHDIAAPRLPGAEVTRGRTEYTSLLLPLGFRHEGFTSYRFRDNPAGLHVLRRIA